MKRGVLVERTNSRAKHVAAVPQLFVIAPFKVGTVRRQMRALSGSDEKSARPQQSSKLGQPRVLRFFVEVRENRDGAHDVERSIGQGRRWCGVDDSVFVAQVT